MSKVFLTLLFLFSCKLGFSQEEAKSENFDRFFIQFNSDKKFQLTRIIFPLHIIHNEYITKSGKEERFIIPQKKWQHINLSNRPNLKEKYAIERISSDKIAVIYQVEDTGIHVQHFFIKVNKKWFLNLIRDDST